MFKRVIYIFLLLILVACSKKTDDRTILHSNDYAEGYAVETFDGYTVVEVRNPWDTLEILQRYILVPKTSELSDEMPDGVVVRTPVERAAVYASLHCGMIKELRKEHTITGICDVHYNADLDLKRRVEVGEVADLGSSFLPDVEKIISIAPEVIIVSPYKDKGDDKVSRLGIPVIEMADYMESLPLARTEWIKFLSMLFECEELADSIFQATEDEYNTLAKVGRSIENRPTLLCELKTGGVWYQPGGESYMAQLYRDAGIDYLWSDNKDKGSISLSYEEVFARGAGADLWLMKYADENDKTLKSLVEEYPPYANFKPCSDKNVWGVNALKVPFYEEMPLYPHYVLRDLMLMAHPEMFLESDTTRYLKKLSDE